MISKTLCTLSGKGGAGKTIVSLSIARVLTEAGFKCLYVDCDTSTHGATYFFERLLENANEISSLVELIETEEVVSTVPTQYGFEFIPSIDQARPEPSNLETSDIHSGFQKIQDYARRFEIDFCIFDCQAGFSPIVLEAAKRGDSKLFVMEPDSISSAALRVLFLHLGTAVNHKNSWQIFNKLTEEERPVYEKVAGGTLFTNLPPLPFDWQVRAAFSMNTVPGVETESSAFGLGVLRLCRALFPGIEEALNFLEERTVGDWYSNILESIDDLQRQETELVDQLHRRDKPHSFMGKLLRLIDRSQAVIQTAMPAIFAVLIVVLVAGTNQLSRLLLDNHLGISLLVILLSGTGLIGYMGARRDKMNALEVEQLSNIEKKGKEIERYKTLILTDPRLREYSRKSD